MRQELFSDFPFLQHYFYGMSCTKKSRKKAQAEEAVAQAAQVRSRAAALTERVAYLEEDLEHVRFSGESRRESPIWYLTQHVGMCYR